jgi:hypothetical protein
MSSISSTANRRTTKSVDVLLVRPRGCRYTPASSPARPAAALIKPRPAPPGPTGAPRKCIANGVIAQLGERFNGIEEVVGSIPSGSTNKIIRRVTPRVRWGCMLGNDWTCIFQTASFHPEARLPFPSPRTHASWA